MTKTSSGSSPKRVWGPTPGQLRGQQRSNAKRGLRGWLDRTSRRLGEREAVELAQLVIEEWVKTACPSWLRTELQPGPSYVEAQRIAAHNESKPKA